MEKIINQNPISEWGRNYLPSTNGTLQGSDIIVAPCGENKNPSKPDQRPWEESFSQEMKVIEYIITLLHINEIFSN